jgi:membrane fusion protein (multidrug efflux system)
VQREVSDLAIGTFVAMSESIMKKLERKVANAVMAVLITAAVSGCTGKASGADSPPPQPQVSVVVTSLQDTPVFSEYVAQTFARDMVEVRGRVDGYIEKRLFETGADVVAGQPLYVLDVRPYEAEVQRANGDLAQSMANQDFANRQVGLLQAQADLAQTEANLVKARMDVERLQPLVDQKAAPQQDLDNAKAALAAIDASVRAKQASVEQARLSTKAQIETTLGQVESSKANVLTTELNLEYATIRAPISGRIGDSLVQVGGLVTRASPQPLTTIVPLDVIWVRFKMSEDEYFEYKRSTPASPHSKPGLQLVLSDGRIFPHEGRIEGTVNQIDSRTGTIELQATFLNPERVLLPGQFGRVRIKTGDRRNVVLVPQRSVQEMQGSQSVLTVGADNKVVAQPVVMGERIGENWIVLQGLKTGERVIVEGLQKAMPGTAVDAKPFGGQ